MQELCRCPSPLTDLSRAKASQSSQSPHANKAPEMDRRHHHRRQPPTRLPWRGGRLPREERRSRPREMHRCGRISRKSAETLLRSRHHDLIRRILLVLDGQGNCFPENSHHIRPIS